MRRATFIHLNMLAYVFVSIITLQLERNASDFDINAWIRRFLAGGILVFLCACLLSLLLRKRKP